MFQFHFTTTDKDFWLCFDLVEIIDVLAFPDKNLFQSFFNIDPRSWTRRCDAALWSAFTSPCRTMRVEDSYWPCCWAIVSTMLMGRPWRSWSPAPKGSQVYVPFSFVVLLCGCVDGWVLSQTRELLTATFCTYAVSFIWIKPICTYLDVFFLNRSGHPVSLPGSFDGPSARSSHAITGQFIFH